MRIMEGFVFLALILFIPPLLFHPIVFHTEGTESSAFFCIFGALMFGAFADAHRVVHGVIDEGGIHYQRYFRCRYIKWEQIESITKRPFGRILVDVEGYNFFNRHLEFIQEIIIFGDKSKSVSFNSFRSAWIRARQFPADPPSEIS